MPVAVPITYKVTVSYLSLGGINVNLDKCISSALKSVGFSSPFGSGFDLTRSIRDIAYDITADKLEEAVNSTDGKNED